MIDEKLFADLSQYILSKTGIRYFGRIKSTPGDIMISCPYHKDGQERKPSCGVKRETDENGTIGTVHCFSCKITTDIPTMIRDLLGDKYDASEIEERFNLSSIQAQFVAEQKKQPLFKIPNKKIVKENILRKYRQYHPYLAERGITEEVANIYDLGYDQYNKQITFPIRDINKNCIGVGRRNVLYKRYVYPVGMIKPLYGIYELPRFIRYLWVVEGPFNLWSLRVWGKTGVALLGTGSDYQIKELLKVKCDGYVLALDPDDAGRNGTLKIGNYLMKNNRFNVYVSLIPTGKDINDLTYDEFKSTEAVKFNQWKYLNGIKE